MKWITFGPQPASTQSIFASVMGAGELTKAPGQAMTASPGALAQKPLSPWVPVGIAAGVGVALFLMLSSMEKSMNQFERGLR